MVKYDLFFLLQAIKSDEEILQYRGLMTLKLIAKELSSKCLASDRMVFREISSRIFGFLEELCYR